jgi:1-deoxy-D-xylulose-5-phosphate reductoisomerase
MCFPIQYALTWPERLAGGLQALDFAKLARLDFEEPRHADFPALGLAREAGLAGGTLPAVFNAAIEVAVDAFIAGAIRFPDIWRVVGDTMHCHEVAAASSLEAVIAADGWAREAANSACRGLAV